LIHEDGPRWNRLLHAGTWRPVRSEKGLAVLLCARTSAGHRTRRRSVAHHVVRPAGTAGKGRQAADAPELSGTVTHAARTSVGVGRRPQEPERRGGYVRPRSLTRWPRLPRIARYGCNALITTTKKAPPPTPTFTRPCFTAWRSSRSPGSWTTSAPSRHPPCGGPHRRRVRAPRERWRSSMTASAAAPTDLAMSPQVAQGPRPAPTPRPEHPARANVELREEAVQRAPPISLCANVPPVSHSTSCP
jgi:hypothetical protein